MGIFTNTAAGNGKSRWTKEQDALLIKMANEGKGRAEIGKACGHPENSITYRIRFIKTAGEKLEAALAEKGEEVTDIISQTLDTIKY